MKIDVKSLWKTKKKWIICIAAGVTAVAAGCGIWYYAGHSSKDPVYVYPFQYIGMTEYWGDSQESHGPVSTDKIQTVFLTDTQTVTEILVQEGDQVKKGDLLMAFDTTLSDLQLERKRLDVEKLKLQLEDARDDMRKINGMRPMKIPSVSDTSEDTGSGKEIDDIKLFPTTDDVENRKKYDGSSAEKALIYWIRNDTLIGDSIFWEAEQHAAEIQEMNRPVPSEPPEGSETPESSEPPEGSETPESSEPSEGGQTGISEGSEVQPSSASAVLPEPRAGGSSFYVVMKTTAGNTTMGSKKVWQCLKVTNTGNGYSFRFADTLISDYSMMGSSSETDAPNIDFGSGYTAAQIAQMKSDKQKEIKDLDFKIKMADAEYKIMLKEVSDGKIYADNDGTVISLLTEEEAKTSQQPILKVSGGGGFYVEGFISELEKDNMKPGQEVTVNDWNTGMTYTGKVESIGDFPSQNGYYNGSGNPNASYYPFQVFVDETADLQAGSYVSIQYSSAESQHGIYLENPFLRTEKGRSYVLVLDAAGKLEQRWVSTGKSLWGSYTEILEGLSAEDLIAFPYGKNVKPGVAAQEGDLSNLYG